MKRPELWADQRAAVRLVLKEQGVTQGELAERMGTAPQFLSQLLVGHKEGRIGTWAEMANALDMRWQLVPIHPTEQTIRWAQTQLGLEMTPQQVVRLRAFLNQQGAS